MSKLEQNRVPDTATGDPRWNALYKVGGGAAWIAVLIFRRWLAAEFLLFRRIGIIRFGPRTMPSSVIDWFTLLHTNRLIGLTLLNVFDMVNYLLVGLIFLALYAALRQVNRSYMTLATALALVGIAVYLASNQAHSMLSLSNQYAAATTDVQRSTLSAAGQALLAINDPNVLSPGAMGFLFVTAAGLIISAVMLRSSVFGKITAYAGILANVFGLGYPIGAAVAPRTVVIPIATTFLSASACFLVVWYIGIARNLFQLGKQTRSESS
jgi:hypothetical protein